MQRAWATGTEQDQGPREWLAAIGEQTHVGDHVRLALDTALAPDASIAQCQAGLLAVECVTYIQGGDADLDPLVHVWMRDLHPLADEALRARGLEVLAAIRAASSLATYWRTEQADRIAEWEAALDGLRDRLTTAKRAPDPREDPRIVAFASDFEAAKPHLRVALVPYEIKDEPIVRVKIAPNLTVVVHYADVGELEPLPVPIEHARAWKQGGAALGELAAKRTREVSGLRTHILENDGFEVNLAFGTTSFTAGLMPYAKLLLPEGTEAPHGMLVSAPNAGTVVYHVIADANWNAAAVEIINQVRDLYEKAGAKISPQLWWWRDGKVIELPYAVVADNVMITPVEKFVKYVKKLT
ncbi:MAG: hypothetical protein QM831_36705 [Kofleriaceae bacterium]